MIEKILKQAVKLVGYIDHVADNVFPQKIVEVVKLHAKLAAVSALIPIPVVDILVCTIAIWIMYFRINSKIGMSIGESIMKTFASGIITNFFFNVMGMLIGSLLKFIPGIGTISGTLIMIVTVYILTLMSGYVYLKSLTALMSKKHK